MRASRLITLMLIGAAASLILPIAVYLATRIAPPLSSDEQIAMAFTPSPLELTPRSWKVVDIICPVSSSFAGASKHSNASPLNGMTALPALSERNLPKVSFILQGATNNMAIIDGTVVKEGTHFKSGRVVRIEQNRILLEGKKGKKWLSME